MWSSTTNTNTDPYTATSTTTTYSGYSGYTYYTTSNSSSGTITIADTGNPIEEMISKRLEEQEEEFTKKYLQLQQEKDELEYKVQELEEKLDEERSKNNR